MIKNKIEFQRDLSFLLQHLCPFGAIAELGTKETKSIAIAFAATLKTGAYDLLQLFVGTNKKTMDFIDNFENRCRRCTSQGMCLGNAFYSPAPFFKTDFRGQINCFTTQLPDICCTSAHLFSHSRKKKPLCGAFGFSPSPMTTDVTSAAHALLNKTS